MIPTIGKIIQRFHPKDLIIKAEKSRCEFSLIQNGKPKEFVATTMDILEVIQEPEPEKFQKWEQLKQKESKFLKTVNEEMTVLFRLFETNHEIVNELNSLNLQGIKEEENLKAIKTADWSEEQKEKWTNFLDLIKEYLKASKASNEAEIETHIRILQTSKGQTVREEKWPNTFKWTYLEKEEPTLKLKFSNYRYQGKTGYKDGKKAWELEFNANRSIAYDHDFLKNTFDYYEKGKKNFRSVHNPKNPSEVLKFQLYDPKERLLDDETLEKMTPTEIEDLFTKISENFASNENEFAKAIFDAAQYIIKCPSGRTILLKASRAVPRTALKKFQNYKDAPYATQILKSVVYEDAIYVENLLKELEDKEKFPGLTEADIVEIRGMTDKKEHNEKTARIVLRIRHEDKETEEAKKVISEFLKDPALQDLPNFQDIWLDGIWEKLKKPSSIDLLTFEEQFKVILARNLFFKNLKMTKENVQKEALQILDKREKYKDIALFKGRNVIFAAHSEMLRDVIADPKNHYSEDDYFSWIKIRKDRHRFGTKSSIEAIRNQQQEKGSFDIFRPEKDLESLRKTKSAILEKIASIPPPMTFIFSGHGAPEGMYFSDGQIGGIASSAEKEKTIKITPDELAQALIQRSENFPQLNAKEPTKKDILIFSSCFNANFIRNLLDRMNGFPKPIVVGADEFGQYGHSDFSLKTDNNFFAKILGLETKSAKNPTTFADVFDQEFNSDIMQNNINQEYHIYIADDNATIYIPDDDNETMQISKNENDSTPENALT